MLHSSAYSLINKHFALKEKRMVKSNILFPKRLIYNGISLHLHFLSDKCYLLIFLSLKEIRIIILSSLNRRRITLFDIYSHTILVWI